LENYKVGALAKFGLSCERPKKVKTSVIHCSITGFGQTGPCRDTAACDFMIHAMGGRISVTGERDDRPRIPHQAQLPRYASTQLCPHLTGATRSFEVLRFAITARLGSGATMCSTCKPAVDDCGCAAPRQTENAALTIMIGLIRSLTMSSKRDRSSATCFLIPLRSVTVDSPGLV
jgi:CoA-transferase family III